MINISNQKWNLNCLLKFIYQSCCINDSLLLNTPRNIYCITFVATCTLNYVRSYTMEVVICCTYYLVYY